MPNDSTYLSLFLRLFDDFSNLVPDYSVAECDADRGTVIKRFRSEGAAFLTKTLPALGKHTDSAFQSGIFEPFSPLKRERGRTTPKFLRSLYKHVFGDNGLILDNPDPVKVGLIRQACFMMYKLESEYSPELETKCIDNFVETDAELADYSASSDSQCRPIIWRARQILNDVFKDFDPRDIIPRPGPGASASGSHKSQRFEPLTIWDQVHQVFPTYEYFYTGTDHLVDRVVAYSQVPRKESPTSKLRMVPKDSRGPRIICMEEQEVMFLQQGLADKMREVISSHHLTRGQVNFFDQTVNQRLATNGSISQLGVTETATLDMKEASDRVSRALVEDLFQDLPILLRALLALSTRGVELPDGLVMRMFKFAPMGSSLCFPIMSIVHFALGVATIEWHTKDPRKAIAKDFYVYGDDLIVNAEHADLLFEVFPKFGLKFNTGKSFVRGPFRESCGVDAFKGMNVTPQRIKKRFFDGRAPQDLLGALDMEGLLYDRGLHATAKYLRSVLEYRNGEFPFVMRGSKVLGWQRSRPTDVEAGMLPHRYNHSYQNGQIKARVFSAKSDCSMVGGWEQLMRFFTGTFRGTQRLDGRFTRYEIAWKWVPHLTLFHWSDDDLDISSADQDFMGSSKPAYGTETLLDTLRLMRLRTKRELLQQENTLEEWDAIPFDWTVELP
jgi:hypothetical protein